MSPEKQRLIHSLRRPIPNLAALYFLASFGGYAFRSKTRKEIKDTSGVCDGCHKNVGKDKLIAAHLNHDRANGATYNSPENGRAFCPLCELDHHLSHHDNSFGTIGVTKQNNASTIYGIWQQLNRDEKNQAAKKHGDKLKKIVNEFQR